MSKRYSDEFKADAAALVNDENRTIEDVAHSLGISRASVGRWARAYRNETPNHKANVAESGTPHNRVQVLEKQVRQLQRERDILKKSIAFFAKDISL